MGTTNVPYSDNDSDIDDDLNNDSATQPLLLQSSKPTAAAAAAASTATIKLPTSIVVPINKSNSAKSTNQNNNNGCSSSSSCIENRVCAKFSHFLTGRFNRTEHNRRSHNRDRWNRINIGLFTISFVSVIYLCVSLNLNVDSKPSPQIIVDVPPVDPDLLGTKGNNSIRMWLCVLILSNHCENIIIDAHFIRIIISVEQAHNTR